MLSTNFHTQSAFFPPHVRCPSVWQALITLHSRDWQKIKTHYIIIHRPLVIRFSISSQLMNVNVVPIFYWTLYLHTAFLNVPGKDYLYIYPHLTGPQTTHSSCQYKTPITWSIVPHSHRSSILISGRELVGPKGCKSVELCVFGARHRPSSFSSSPQPPRSFPPWTGAALSLIPAPLRPLLSPCGWATL